MSFDDAEWQLKKVNAELKKVNREINDLREIVTALQQGESLTDALGAVEEDKESQCQCGFSHRGPCLKYDDKMGLEPGEIHSIHLEGTPLVDHILKNDFWEEVAETDDEVISRYAAIYAPKPGEVWRLHTETSFTMTRESMVDVLHGEMPHENDFVTALEKHPYVDTVQTHEFGCVTVITFHALGDKFDWHYKFDLYQVGNSVMYIACRWTDEEYSG